jgi:hypothetical protein
MYLESVHLPKGRRFEPLQCSLHDPAGHAIARALQELAKGHRRVPDIMLLAPVNGETFSSLPIVLAYRIAGVDVVELYCDMNLKEL